MRQFKSSILFLFTLGILACSNSNHKSEDNIAVVNDQEAVQVQEKPEIRTEGDAQQESQQFTSPQLTGNKDVSLSHKTESISLNILSDSLKKEIAAEDEKIALSRKKIFNYQEELNFFRSQQNKLNTDDSMNDALDRINQNIETVQGYIEKEEEKINLAKSNISQLEEDIKNVKNRNIQASTTIILEEKEEKAGSDEGQEKIINPDLLLANMDTQDLEQELNDLLILKDQVNKKLLFVEGRLDSLKMASLDPKDDVVQKQEELPPKIAANKKNIHGDIDQQAANQLQDLASKTISRKRSLSADQVNTAKERNATVTTIQSNRGFAKFVGIFFLIILVLIGSLYFLGKSFPGKKKE